MILRFDLETIPTTNPEVLLQFHAKAKENADKAIAEISAPSNYKDEAKIAEYIANKRSAILVGLNAEYNDMVSKTSFSGLHGNIACAAWAWDDEDPQSSHCGDTEADVINRLYADINERTKVEYRGGSTFTSIPIAGYNIVGFDLPFLKHRSIILGINPPACIKAAFKAKPWDSNVLDTMLMWSPDIQKRVSMDNLAKALGMKGKDGFDGSMVAEAWAEGEHQKVIDYCKDDVALDRAIYKRLIWE